MQITEKDFDGLTAVSMEWGDTWRSKKGRFSMWEGETLSFQWGMAYWFSDYPSVFLAKQFLIQESCDFQICMDEASDDFVIVTNFRTVGWRK